MWIAPRPEDKDTVLLLAGDIAVGKRPSTYVEFLTRAVRDFRRVVYIPGNHEYYGGSFAITWERMKEKLADAIGDDVDRLDMINDESVIVDNVAIVGATLWADFDRQNPSVMAHAASGMNDYRVIQRGRDGEPYSGKLRPQDTLNAHLNSREFIFREVEKHKLGGYKVLVMTHHGPSWNSVAEAFVGSPLNGAYVTEFGYQLLDLTDRGLAPDVWVHGHVHSSFDYTIGDTRVLTNPRGYVTNETPNGDNPHFNPKLAFEL